MAKTTMRVQAIGLSRKETRRYFGCPAASRVRVAGSRGARLTKPTLETRCRLELDVLSGRPIMKIILDLRCFHRCSLFAALLRSRLDDPRAIYITRIVSVESMNPDDSAVLQQPSIRLGEDESGILFIPTGAIV